MNRREAREYVAARQRGESRTNAHELANDDGISHWLHTSPLKYKWHVAIAAATPLLIWLGFLLYHIWWLIAHHQFWG